jgi:hypothetical protein
MLAITKGILYYISPHLKQPNARRANLIELTTAKMNHGSRTIGRPAARRQTTTSRLRPFRASQALSW